MYEYVYNKLTSNLQLFVDKWSVWKCWKCIVDNDGELVLSF